MNKPCLFTGALLFGYAGSFLGARLGREFFGRFRLSGLISIIGVRAGWKVAQRRG